MVRSQNALLKRLQGALHSDSFWAGHLLAFSESKQPDQSLHVAVFQEPFLTWVLEGRKPVESRFSQNQVNPYGAVHAGDTILLKQVAGPIKGIAHVRSSSSYRLDPRTWKFLREEFAEMLCATEESFWTSRGAARFATLIFLEEVRVLPNIEYAKSDRRGWVVECGPQRQQLLDL